MGEALAIIAFGIGVFALGFLTGFGATTDHLRAQAIERGYALYCPIDGKWAWKEECDD